MNIIKEGYATKIKPGAFLSHTRYFVIYSNATLNIFHSKTGSKGDGNDARNHYDLTKCTVLMQGNSIKIESIDKTDSFVMKFPSEKDAIMWNDAISEARDRITIAPVRKPSGILAKKASLVAASTAMAAAASSASLTATGNASPSSTLNVTQLRIAESNKAMAQDGKVLLLRAMSSSKEFSSEILTKQSGLSQKTPSPSLATFPQQFGQQQQQQDTDDVLAASKLIMRKISTMKKLKQRSSSGDPDFVHENDNGESWAKGKGGDDISQTPTLLKETGAAEISKNLGPPALARLTSLRIQSKIDILRSIVDSAFPTKMYAQVGCEDLLVRGPTYLTDGKKITPKRSLFKLICIDLFDTGKERYDHISSHPNNRIAQAIKANEMPPFVWTINFQVPGPPFYSFVIYLAPQDTMTAALFGADVSPSTSRPDFPPGLLNMFKSFFLSKDDEYRDSRFKLVPRIVDGPWLVRSSVPNKPALLGRALKQRYFQGPGYLELDIDIGSSKVAWSITRLALGYAAKLVVDLAFCIQGNSEDELPEEVLAVVRAINVEFKNVDKL